MTFAQGAKGSRASARRRHVLATLTACCWDRRVGSSPCEVVGLAKRDRDPYPCPRIRAMVLVEYE